MISAWMPKGKRVTAEQLMGGPPEVPEDREEFVAQMNRRAALAREKEDGRCP